MTMKKVSLWMCMLLCSFLLKATPSQGLQCFKCTLHDNPNCVDKFPPKGIAKADQDKHQVPCASYDVGCIIYEYYKDGQRIGGQRCMCKAEKDCLDEQGVTLDEDNGETKVQVSWAEYEECMKNYNKLPGYDLVTLPAVNGTQVSIDAIVDDPQNEPKTELTISFCEDDGCNKKGKKAKKSGGSKPRGLMLNVMIPLLASYLGSKML